MHSQSPGKTRPSLTPCPRTPKEQSFPFRRVGKQRKSSGTPTLSIQKSTRSSLRLGLCMAFHPFVKSSCSLMANWQGCLGPFPSYLQVALFQDSGGQSWALMRSIFGNTKSISPHSFPGSVMGKIIPLKSGWLG